MPGLTGHFQFVPVSVSRKATLEISLVPAWSSATILESPLSKSALSSEMVPRLAAETWLSAKNRAVDRETPRIVKLLMAALALTRLLGTPTVPSVGAKHELIETAPREGQEPESRISVTLKTRLTLAAGK